MVSGEKFTERDWKVSKTQSGPEVQGQQYGIDSKHNSCISKNTTLFRDIIETYDQEEKDAEKMSLKD